MPGQRTSRIALPEQLLLSRHFPVLLKLYLLLEMSVVTEPLASIRPCQLQQYISSFAEMVLCTAEGLLQFSLCLIPICLLTFVLSFSTSFLQKTFYVIFFFFCSEFMQNLNLKNCKIILELIFRYMYSLTYSRENIFRSSK